MSKAHWLSFLMIIIGLLLLMSIEVDAQPTMDDNPSCESTTLDKGVIDLITRGFSDVKNVCGACQQTRIVIDSSLCEYIKLIRVFVFVDAVRMPLGVHYMSIA